MAESLQYAPGNIIQEFEEPFVKVICKSHKGFGMDQKRLIGSFYKLKIRLRTHCSNCFKHSYNLLRCGGCKKAHYCNKHCQRLDWKSAHSIECKSQLFANPQTISIVDPDYIYQLIRLMAFLHLHAEEAQKTHKLYDGSTRCYNDLVDYKEKIKNDPKFQKDIKLIVGKLNEFDSKLFSCEERDYDNINRLTGVWKINGFCITNDEDTQQIGSALYIMSASYDHVCRPNAVRILDDMQRMQVRCIEAIPFGVSPKITYLAGIRDRAARQKLLKERYYFTCECILCEAEKEGPLIKYDQLHYVKTILLDREREFRDTQLLLANMVIENMQNLFYKFDERITNFCDEVLEKLVRTTQGMNAWMVTLSEVKIFAFDVEERLRITFGVQNKNYKYFITEIAPRLKRARKFRR